MFLSVNIFANVGPVFEVLESFFVVLVVLVKNADVDVKAASEGVIFAERQFRQFHHAIVQLLLFGTSTWGQNS